MVAERCPGAIMIAEEFNGVAWRELGQSLVGDSVLPTNGTWGGCTTRCSIWKESQLHRQYHHNDMTFGLLYAFTENFILPLSHDEVVYGKKSLIGKMPGDRWQRFANLRAYFGFMWSHPGKKLLFMGGEFAQEREWSHDREELDWPSLNDPLHAGFQRLVRDLNRLYVRAGAACPAIATRAASNG